MDIAFDSLLTIFLSSITMFAIYYSLYKRFIYSIVDPLLLWVVLTSFASVLCIEVIPENKYVIHFFGCQLFLWFGMMIAYKPFGFKHFESNNLENKYNFTEESTLKIVTYIFCACYFFSNLIVAWNKGFALLSDAPSEAKIADFQNGFGFFRKLNWSIGTFIALSLTFLYFKSEKRERIYGFLLLLVAAFTSLDGSKAAFLRIISSIGIVLYHSSFLAGRDLIKKFTFYSPLLILISLSVVFSILYKENETLDGAFLAFIKRLLFSADSILYFYQPINLDYFENYNFADYLSRITNPILGFLRIQDYQDTPGNIMVDNLRLPGASDYVTVGPNAPFYIEGRIYFNYWVAFIYSSIIGFSYGKIRTYYFSMKRGTAFFFIYVGAMLQLLEALLVDTNLAVVQLFNLFIYVYIPYLVVKFLLKKKISIKLNIFK